MPIAFKDITTGRELVAHLAEGVTPEDAATAMQLVPGSWRVVTEQEAIVIQQPTADELKAQRRQEILARLGVLDTDSVRPMRALARNTASDFDMKKLATIEQEADALRDELSTLPLAA